MLTYLTYLGVTLAICITAVIPWMFGFAMLTMGERTREHLAGLALLCFTMPVIVMWLKWLVSHP